MFKKGLFNVIIFIKQLINRIGQALTANPKLILLLMLAVVFLGVINIFLNRDKTTGNRSENFQNLFRELPYPDSIISKKSPGVTDIYDILRMESELEQILKKDSLTKEDSIFIMELDEKLNKLIDE